jgi:hypothetical protein
MTVADAECTTNPRVSSVEFLHASERAGADAQTDGEKERGQERDFLGVIEEALDEERARLMLVNSMLGCVQIALDPEAVSVVPAVCFPEVLEMARTLINKSVRGLEYDEIRRLLHREMGCAH